MCGLAHITGNNNFIGVTTRSLQKGDKFLFQNCPLMFRAYVLLMQFWVHNTNMCRATAQVSRRGAPVLISG
jgi:hypothetical protein